VAIFAMEDAFEILGGFTVDEALVKSAALQPDAVLFDLPQNPPVPDYIEKLSLMKQECPCSMLLVLADNEPPDRLAGVLTLGIDGCIPKNIMRGSLVKTIELTCRTGILCLPGSLKKAVFFSVSEAIQRVGCFNKQVAGNRESLTRREMEILTFMAKNYSNREIARKLYISEPTVKTHVSSILRKLGKSNRAQAVVYSYQAGLISEFCAMHE